MKFAGSASHNGLTPVSPVQQHLRLSGNAVNHLISFFELAIAGDWKKAKDLQLKIRKLEVQSQQLKKRLRLQISRFLPLSELCSELVELLTLQNDVACRTRSIAATVVTRRMAFPDEISEQLLEMVQSTVEVSGKNLTLVDQFDHSLVARNSLQEVDFIERMIADLDRLELTTDQLAEKIRIRLFKLEKKLSACELVALHRLIDSISTLADRSQTIGSHLQLMLMH